MKETAKHSRYINTVIFNRQDGGNCRVENEFQLVSVYESEYNTFTFTQKILPKHLRLIHLKVQEKKSQTLANLKIKIGCTPDELKSAQQLRHEIFNVEMQSDVPAAQMAGIDHDRFDDICDHLIIIDEDKNAIVGTYRLLLGSVAAKNEGFYSETKFNLDPVKRLKGGMLEVGRACIQKDYRRSQVLNLLWQGIAQYCKERQVRYIFGCANIMTIDPKQISEYYCMLKALGLVKQIGIEPVDKTRAITIDEHMTIENPRKIFLKLPVLFKGYMSLGLKVCSYPIEGSFGSAIFFVLLDMADMNKSYKRRFLGDYLNESSTEKR